MTFASNVQPRKIPLRPKPRRWTCDCRTHTPEPGDLDWWSRQMNPGYLARCPVCKSDRPKEA